MTVPVASVVAAPNVDVSVGADVEYHDNAGLTSSDEVSDIERVARAAINLDNNDDGSLLVNLGYTVGRHDFVDDVQEDRTVVEGQSNLNWSAIPRLLDVLFFHSVSDELRSNQDADVTGNRERRNVTMGGVNLYRQLSSVDKITVGPRVTDVQLESNTGSDSRHSALDLTWQHNLSAVSSLALNGYGDSVRFDDSINDYDQKNVTLSYNARLARLQYSIGGGFNWIDRDEGKSVDGYTLRITADYVDQGYSWGGSVVRQLTDSAVGLAGVGFQIPNLESTDGNVDEFDIVEVTEAELHGRRELGAASALSGGVKYSYQDYQDTLRDQRSYEASLTYAYSINTAWSLNASVSYTDTDYLDDPLGLKQKDTDILLYLNYRLNTRLNARFGLGSEKRDSDRAETGYTDNTVFASFNYQFF